MQPTPGLYYGRGIVITAGGYPYQIHQAYAHIKLLRRLGCRLPVEIWRSQRRDGRLLKATRQAFDQLHDVRIREIEFVVPDTMPAGFLQALPTDLD